MPIPSRRVKEDSDSNDDNIIRKSGEKINKQTLRDQTRGTSG